MRLASLVRFAVLGGLLACADATSTSGPPDRGTGNGTVSQVVVSPNSTRLGRSRSLQLLASLRDISGRAIIGPAVSWSSSNAGIASVSADGMVTAIQPGSATITASSSGLIGQAIIEVSDVAVAQVTLRPDSTTMFDGQFATLFATLTDSTGAVLTNRAVTWTTSDAQVAGVSTTGIVNAANPGRAVITATAEERSASAVVIVQPVLVASITLSPATLTLSPPNSGQLDATLRDGSGGQLFGRTVTWATSDSTIATVSAAGQVKAVRFGTAVISATSDGAMAQASVSVQPAQPLRLTVTANAGTITVGQSTQLAAVVHDANGNLVPGTTVSWSSGTPGVVTVSPSGLATAVAPGSAVVTASASGVSGSTTLTVSPAAVASVAITPVPLSVATGGTVQLTATTRDASGNTLAGRAVTWQSANSGIATVSGTGLLTGVAQGTVNITATSEGVSTTVQATVTAPPTVAIASVGVGASAFTVVTGGTASFTATPRDAANNPLSGRVCTWRSSAPAIMSVTSTSATTAVGNALAAGGATIIATCEGVSGNVGMTVTLAAVAAVSVSPSALSLVVGQSGTLQATARDANGNVLGGRTTTWTSLSPGIVSVTSGGVVTAIAAGTGTVQATIGGQSAAATVTVRPVAVASTVLSPASTAIVTGQTVHLVATAYDALGNVLTGRQVQWLSQTTDVATVDASGNVTGVAAGTATIRATIDGQPGLAQVAVTLPAVNDVALTPNGGALVVGQTLQFTATPHDANGNVLTGRSCSWGSSAIAIANVSPTGGLVSALAPGNATITVTCEGKSASAAVTVSPIPVASVTVTPATLSVVAGATSTLTAVPRDASGNAIGGRTVAWQSSNTAVATVSAAGVVTAVAAGSATITATVDGVSGTSSVTVTRPAVASVTVTPNTASVAVGGTAQLTAQALDANGNVLTRTITWKSSDSTIASVSASGVVTGLAAGAVSISATAGGVTGTATVTVTAGTGGGGPGGSYGVTSVVVTPATASVTEGGTVQLAAQAKNASGATVIGPVVTWASSNPGVAGVSSTGLVTAVTAGSATISATAEGVSGTSVITVTSATGTGSCPVPNLRGIQTYDSGKVDSLNASEGWYLFSPYNYRVVQDPTAHGGWSFENDFTYSPGSDQGTAVEGVFANHAQQKVYMRMRYKQDPTFDNSGIKKLMRFQGPQGLVGGIASMWGRFLLGLDALSDGVNRGINVGSEAGFYPDDLKGSWHTYEFMADFTTAGHLKYKFWIDGQLKMDYDIPKSSNGATIYLAMFDGTWNAPGGTTKSWMDDNAVSTQCIGLQ